MSKESQRKAFENWISAPPYEKDVTRFPRNERVSAWPGQYRDIAVELAWDAWEESANQMRAELQEDDLK